VGPRAGLDAVAKRKNPCPCRKPNTGPPHRKLVTILTENSDAGILYVNKYIRK